MKSICERLAHASQVAFREVSFADGSLPVESACHQNADKWVKENPGTVVVRGWVTYADFGASIGLTAHSVIRDRDGELADITPLENKRDRAGMRFLSHVGTEQEFAKIKESGIFIECPKE
ncbi:MAG TPA: hypothetical protein VGS27_16665 [Candidatus Sulfotelmatobacter sp.]|nr:hypothetical protein [Candidatus Sulfotelmatobacter sp.]